MEGQWMYPVLLDSHNYTSLRRTPWAGSKIASLYKDELFPNEVESRVGESWEFSCDPSFPSKTQGAEITLSSLIKTDPQKFLGSSSDQGFCEILVKLLNASSPLSVQVHPEDGDEALAVDECGKPESWLVLDADPGCGLYLGFSKPLSRDELGSAFSSGADVSDLLHFVPVKPGDYFEISPGVPHAIGPGVCLLEPQRILFGKSGKTYRMWDWGRKYNEDGELDLANGQGRELHLDAALKLVDPTNQVGEEFVAETRREPVVNCLSSEVTVSSFPSNPYYQTHVFEIAKGGCLKLSVKGGYGAFTCLKGGLSDQNELRYPKGQSAFFPAECFPLELRATEDSFASLVIPATSKLCF